MSADAETIHIEMMMRLRDLHAEPTQAETIAFLLREIADLRAQIAHLESDAEERRWAEMGEDL